MAAPVVAAVAAKAAEAILDHLKCLVKVEY